MLTRGRMIQAVSSCASDATYHVMWIILFNALDDYGVKETNGATHEQIDAAKRKIADEALHGALRIAGLVRKNENSILNVPINLWC